MKKHDEAFYEQVAYLLKQYRDGHVKSIPDLMQLMQMTYGDYVEFHPNELPETKYDYKPDTIPKEGGGEPKLPPAERGESVRQVLPEDN